VTGERLAWFRLASHLHVPVQELQEKTTSSEFIEWMRFLEIDMGSFHREDYYAARIVQEIRRGWTFPNSKNPVDRPLEDFLLKFEKPKIKSMGKNPAYDSKSTWLGILGVKK
jgi:hypothetical protein